MSVLQSESGFFVRKAELFRLGPELDDVRRGDSGLHDADRGVHVVAAALVGVHHRGRGAADREGPVVAGAIAVVAVQDVEEGRISGTENTVRVDMRMRAAALAG